MKGLTVANQPTPMVIRLYDPKGEFQEFTQMIVPWGLLKMAVKISTNLDPEHITESDIDAMAGLVCAVFGNRFSIEDLNNGAEISEMMTVINTIVAKANTGIKGNPTLPG